MNEHWFWWSLAMACLIWYATITVYVGIKGIFDIKTMLRRLKEKQSAAAKSAEPPAGERKE